MSKWKDWGANLALTLGSLVVGVVIGEVGLRVAGVNGYPRIGDVVDSAPTIFHTADPDRGWGLKPGIAAEWRGEGESFVQINQDGLRDREHSKAKPPNTLRIAVLGDSFTEAIHVPAERTFWSRIERRLAKCREIKGRGVEVINFGVQGYSTAQELITLRKKVWDYAPDLVILAFFVGNDVINNSPQLEYDRYRPFFVYNDQGQLVEDFSFRNLAPIDRNSYAVSLVDRLPSWLVNNSQILQVAKKAELDSKKRVLSDQFTTLSAQTFREPQDETWKQAWRVTEGMITLMQNEVAQKQADFLLVIVPDPIQIHPHTASRQEYMQKYNITDLLYPNKRLQTLGQQQGFSVLDLASPFLNYASVNKTCLNGFDNAIPCGGHWNLQGHGLAGRLIADRLCEDAKEQKLKSLQK